MTDTPTPADAALRDDGDRGPWSSQQPNPPTCEGRSPNDGYNALRQFCLGNWYRDAAAPNVAYPGADAALMAEAMREMRLLVPCAWKCDWALEATHVNPQLCSTCVRSQALVNSLLDPLRRLAAENADLRENLLACEAARDDYESRVAYYRPRYIELTAQLADSDAENAGLRTSAAAFHAESCAMHRENVALRSESDARVAAAVSEMREQVRNAIIGAAPSGHSSECEATHDEGFSHTHAGVPCECDRCDTIAEALALVDALPIPHANALDAVQRQEYERGKREGRASARALLRTARVHEAERRGAERALRDALENNPCTCGMFPDPDLGEWLAERLAVLFPTPRPVEGEK